MIVGYTNTALKRRKLDELELKDELFGLFTECEQLSFDDIQREVDQPRNFLQGILDDICEKRKIRNKFMYNLKPEYLTQEEKAGKPVKKTKL